MVCFRLLLLLLAALAVLTGQSARSGMSVPKYAADGSLLRPEDFRTWVFVGASMGLSYSEGAAPKNPLMHHVYMQPQAYEHFARTGVFPEKTMFVLALYEPEQKKSINKNGYFSGQLVAQEVALKDKERFPEGWAYFDFGGRNGFKQQAQAFPQDRCFSCHKEHGESDNVFVQFYPVLRRLKNPGAER